MDQFLALAKYFVWNPLPAYLMAVGFFAAYLIFLAIRVLRNLPRLRATPLLVAGVAWLLFGLNEYYSKINGVNIRVDLIATWPAIWGLTAICLYLAALSLWKME